MTRASIFPPFTIIEGDRAKGLVLIADHARNALPDEYGDLGLPENEFRRHIAYDIGVEAVTTQLAAMTGAPAVLRGRSLTRVGPLLHPTSRISAAVTA